MSEPINLNRARKARAAQDAKATAAENRAKFGRTKAQKLTESAATARMARSLDGKKREEP